jgi:hypothetical protein
MFSSQAGVRPALWVFFGLMVSLLIAGTLKINLLTDTYFSISLLESLPTALVGFLQSVHLDIQGVVLIVFLVSIGIFAFFGFENVLDRFSKNTVVTLPCSSY